MARHSTTIRMERSPSQFWFFSRARSRNGKQNHATKHPEVQSKRQSFFAAFRRGSLPRTNVLIALGRCPRHPDTERGRESFSATCFFLVEIKLENDSRPL